MSAKRMPKSSQSAYPIFPPTLILSGALLSALSYTVLGSTPLTGLGISTVLIGVIYYAIVKEQPKIPPQASAILLQTGVENTSALVEETGLKNKAVYLPS